MDARLEPCDPLPDALAQLAAVDGPGSSAALHALTVLAALPADGPGLSSHEIAQRLDVDVDLLHDYLGRALAAGLLERDSFPRRYRRASGSSPLTAA